MSKGTEVLRLYKTLMREGQKFTSYNFRNYALRRIRDSFKENKALDDPLKVQEQVKAAKVNLEMIKRQVVIGGMYQTHKLVIEDDKPLPGGGIN